MAGFDENNVNGSCVTYISDTLIGCSVWGGVTTINGTSPQCHYLCFLSKQCRETSPSEMRL